MQDFRRRLLLPQPAASVLRFEGGARRKLLQTRVDLGAGCRPVAAMHDLRIGFQQAVGFQPRDCGLRGE